MSHSQYLLKMHCQVPSTFQYVVAPFSRMQVNCTTYYDNKWWNHNLESTNTTSWTCCILQSLAVGRKKRHGQMIRVQRADEEWGGKHSWRWYSSGWLCCDFWCLRWCVHGSLAVTSIGFSSWNPQQWCGRHWNMLFCACWPWCSIAQTLPWCLPEAGCWVESDVKVESYLSR